MTLVTLDELTEDEKAATPAWFLDALGEDGPNGVIAATNHWRSVVPGALDDAATLFRERAIALCLAREAERPEELVLIYVLRSDTEPYTCWYGYIPTDRLDNRTPAQARPGVRVDLTQVSEELRAFYTQIHDMFRLSGPLMCGFAPLDELFTLDGDSSDYEYWGEADHQPDPQRLVPVFLSSNGHLCVERGTDEAWSQDDSILEPLGDLWPNINTWIRRFTEARS